MADTSRPSPFPVVASRELVPEATTRRLVFYLSRNVSHARQRAGLTQLQLAEAAELSRATIHLIEGGIGDPRLSTIARLADALRTDTLRLLADEATDSQVHT